MGIAHSVQVEPSSEAQPPAQPNCIICGDQQPARRMVTVPCPSRHRYCRECIRSLFIHATRDETLMPPCCDRVPIPLDLVRPLLSYHELDRFERKEYEFSTEDRLYCARPTCSEFLGPASEGMRECDSCPTLTCGGCKLEWHGDKKGKGSCGGRKDASDEVVAQALAANFHFQRCPGCRRVVELSSGCFHM